MYSIHSVLPWFNKIAYHREDQEVSMGQCLLLGVGRWLESVKKGKGLGSMHSTTLPLESLSFSHRCTLFCRHIVHSFFTTSSKESLSAF